MEPQVVLPPSIDEVPPPGLAIVEELDKLMLVQLRDGRKIIGILRSFDQFANLVLEGGSQAVPQLAAAKVCAALPKTEEADLQLPWPSKGGSFTPRCATLAQQPCRALQVHNVVARPVGKAAKPPACRSTRTPQPLASPLLGLHPHCPISPPPTCPAGARERIIVGSQYGEIPLGLHVLRGENVVLMGEIDEAQDPPAGLTQASGFVLAVPPRLGFPLEVVCLQWQSE